MGSPAVIVDLKIPTVALVGRVNVGKSTLFNRLTETQHAMVSKIAGTTRTRNVGIVTWRGTNFRLVDTGGLTFTEDIPLEDDIIRQTELAVKEADLVIMVSDVAEGILPQEKELAKKFLARYKDKPLLFVANKADSPSLRLRVHDREWRSLELGEPIPVSAQNGSGTGDLLDSIYAIISKTKGASKPKALDDVRPIKIAIVGKPNVGKSSLFNKLIGEDRVIVSDIPHTTREPHDTLVEWEGIRMLFVDTAGIRKKTKVHGELEKLGIGKSIEMIDRSDIVLFVLDANEPITDQDKQLAGLLREHTKSVIIVVNKWDQAEGNDDAFRNDVYTMIYVNFPHIDFAPIILVSAATEYRVHQIFPLIKRAWEERHTVIPETELKEFIKATTRRHLPSRGKGVRHPSIIDFNQLGANPPVFDLLLKYKTDLSMSYINYLENRLREKFGFYASPIIIKLSKMKRTI
ncbi:MAG: ribosome biogenesis GTPase Der [bacterium]|nr:ribosome biogenesis GTPase Der [bacterium]